MEYTDRGLILAAARKKRDDASRVRRLAASMSLNRDRDRLMREAASLEKEAVQLEKWAADEALAPTTPEANTPKDPDGKG